MPLRVLMFQNKLELLVPAVIVEEFSRNRPRLEAAVTTSVLDGLRQLRRELREYAGQQSEPPNVRNRRVRTGPDW